MSQLILLIAIAIGLDLAVKQIRKSARRDNIYEDKKETKCRKK